MTLPSAATSGPLEASTDAGPDADPVATPTSPDSTGTSSPPRHASTVPELPEPYGQGVLAVAVVAALLGALCTSRLWVHPGSRMVSGNIPDATHYSWWLAHTPYAIFHGQNPFTTTAMNWPIGVGTMNNTTLVLPSLVLAPVTWLFGSLATLNVLNILAVPACIAAGYWALRQADVVHGRFGEQVSRPVALAGGVVFGISPAIVNSLVGHVTMAFAPGLPILLVLGVRAWLSPRPWRAGRWLGLAAAVQVFIGEEVLFQAGLGSLIILVVAGLSRPRQVPAALGRAVRSLGLAVVIVLVLAGYALYQQFFGPLRQHGSPFLADYYGADLTAFFTTSDRLILHTGAGTLATAAFPGGIEEHLAYLGVPLLVLCLVVAVTGWRRVAVRCAFAGLVLSMVLSLGGRIWIGGEQQTWRGPYALLQSFPVTEASLATRLGLLAAVFAGALLGLGLQAILATRPAVSELSPGAVSLSERSPDALLAGGEPALASLSERSPRAVSLAGREPALPVSGRAAWTTPAVRGVVAGLVALVCLAPLVPRVLPVQQAPPIPAYFSTTARLMPTGTVLVVLPYPNGLDPVAMRWQVAAGFAFSMPGGYFLGPGGSQAHAYVGGDADPVFANLLQQVAQTNQPAPVTPELRAQAKTDLGNWNPAALVLGPSASTEALRITLTALLGEPTMDGGVWIWKNPAQLAGP